MRYVNILSAVAGSPWAIREEKGRAMVDFLKFAAMGGRHSDAEFEAMIGRPRMAFDDGETGEERRRRIEAAEQKAVADRGGVAVISLAGIISPRMSAEMDVSTGGGTSAEGFTRRLNAVLADQRVGGVIVDVDSPGGNVLGITETATALYAARGGDKPIVAIANLDCCSAAYHLASAAGELVASPSAEVGSIGVYAYHEDISKALAAQGRTITLVKAGPNKAETASTEPLSDAARAHMQARVDDYYRMMVADIARGRGIDASAVIDRFGGGRAFGAEEALQRGMVDRVATLDQEIQRMSERLSQPAARKRSAVEDKRRAMALW